LPDKKDYYLLDEELINQDIPDDESAQLEFILKCE